MKCKGLKCYSAVTAWHRQVMTDAMRIKTWEQFPCKSHCVEQEVFLVRSSRAPTHTAFELLEFPAFTKLTNITKD